MKPPDIGASLDSLIQTLYPAGWYQGPTSLRTDLGIQLVGAVGEYARLQGTTFSVYETQLTPAGAGSDSTVLPVPDDALAVLAVGVETTSGANFLNAHVALNIRTTAPLADRYVPLWTGASYIDPYILGQYDILPAFIPEADALELVGVTQSPIRQLQTIVQTSGASGTYTFTILIARPNDDLSGKHVLPFGVRG